MRMHTSLSKDEVRQALQVVKAEGLVGQGVLPLVMEEHRSETHPRSFEIQLGTAAYEALPADATNKYGRPQKTRRANHNGTGFAATWSEWGWFIAELYRMDPESRWGTRPPASGSWGYFSAADFHAKTDRMFEGRAVR